MQTCKIGICSRDPEYGASLMMALKRISGGRIEAMVFSSPEVMTVCLAVQETELLVLDGWKKDALGSEFSETGISVCMLTEQPSDQGIYKYQSARDICKALLGVLQKERSVSSQPSGCLAVFSPLGRCGKTALARALLQADTDQEGLYIGMEAYPDRLVHSEVLYLVKQRSPDLYEAVLREQTSEEGYRSLYVSGIFSELQDVQRGDLEWFRDQLLQPGRCRTLIFDLNGASLSDLSMLNVFDTIYMPVLPDPVSQAKIRTMRSVFRERKQGDVLRRMCPVEITEDVLRNNDPDRIRRCLFGTGTAGEA